MSMFGVVYAAEGSSPEALVAVAREFSPRVEVCVSSAREVELDLAGLARLFGDARTIAEELRRTAADRGLRVRIAIAATRTTARLLVRHRVGLTVIEPGMELAALASVPLTTLAAIATVPNAKPRGVSSIRNGPNDPNAPNDPNDPNAPNDPNGLCHTFRRWGLRTCGDLAALPSADVAARLGQEGVRWQRLACGDDLRPLVPSVPEERFEEMLQLEWPIEGLEPLSFVLGRVLEPLAAHLARRDRAAAVLHVRLHLVTRDIHTRSLQLPAPIRDPRTLRTLALLDLESHPPNAAIDRVIVAVDPTPERILQFSLLTRPLPSFEQLSTLVARLTALMGEGRCGSPLEKDSWQPGAFDMKPFNPVAAGAPPATGDGCVVAASAASNVPIVAVRRYRFPVPARVQVDQGKPVRLTTDRRELSGGRVETCAGPWRSSGGWWEDAAPASTPRTWDRDEWDMTLTDGATWRVFRDRDSGGWFVEGVVD